MPPSFTRVATNDLIQAAHVNQMQVVLESLGLTQNVGEVASTLTPNLGLGSNVVATLTGNVTIAPTTTHSVGSELVLVLTQDAIGSRTVTWDPQYRVNVTVAAAAFATTVICLLYAAGGWVQIASAAPAIATLNDHTLLYANNASGRYQIYSMDLTTGVHTRLITDSTRDYFWPRLSPNRQKILFHSAPAGVHDTDFTQVRAHLMNVDGTGLTRILKAASDSGGNEHGWLLLGHGDWAPDGTHLLFSVGTVGLDIQLAEVDPDGTAPITYHSPTGQTVIDGSYWPDGTGVAYSRQTTPGTASTLDIRHVTFGVGIVNVTSNALEDYDPYGRPGGVGVIGTHIAWLQKQTGGSGNDWDIMLALADGSSPVNLTNHAALGDAPGGAVNGPPMWSRDGMTIYWHRGRWGVDGNWNLWKINPFAGTPSTTLVNLTAGRPGFHEFPAI